MVGTLWWCCGAVAAESPACDEELRCGRRTTERFLCVLLLPNHQPGNLAAWHRSRTAPSWLQENDAWVVGRGIWWWISQVQQGKTEKEGSACGLCGRLLPLIKETFAGPQSVRQFAMALGGGETLCIYLSLLLVLSFGCFSYRPTSAGPRKGLCCPLIPPPPPTSPVSPLPPF